MRRSQDFVSEADCLFQDTSPQTKIFGIEGSWGECHQMHSQRNFSTGKHLEDEIDC